MAFLRRSLCKNDPTPPNSNNWSQPPAQTTGPNNDFESGVKWEEKKSPSKDNDVYLAALINRTQELWKGFDERRCNGYPFPNESAVLMDINEFFQLEVVVWQCLAPRSHVGMLVLSIQQIYDSPDEAKNHLPPSTVWGERTHAEMEQLVDSFPSESGDKHEECLLDRAKTRYQPSREKNKSRKGGTNITSNSKTGQFKYEENKQRYVIENEGHARSIEPRQTVQDRSRILDESPFRYNRRTMSGNGQEVYRCGVNFTQARIRHLQMFMTSGADDSDMFLSKISANILITPTFKLASF
ncbi:hypothetical protein Tco_0611309 [Tanacetum coccineum]